MNLYHSWFYINVLNTKWLVWSFVGFIFVANMLSPIIFWYLIGGRTKNIK